MFNEIKITVKEKEIDKAFSLIHLGETLIHHGYNILKETGSIEMLPNDGAKTTSESEQLNGGLDYSRCAIFDFIERYYEVPMLDAYLGRQPKSKA